MICKQKQVNAFFDPVLRLRSSSMGGKVTGKRNAESDHLKRIAKLPRTYKNKKWITNGTKSRLLYESEIMPEGFYYGRVIKAKKIR